LQHYVLLLARTALLQEENDQNFAGLDSEEEENDGYERDMEKYFGR